MLQVWTSEQRKKLRAIFAGNQCFSPATVYDALSARVAGSVGFEIGMLAGSVASNTTLAAPDLILITLTEFADQVRRIMRDSNLSLVVDADHARRGGERLGADDRFRRLRLQHFRGEYEAHVRDGRCPMGAAHARPTATVAPSTVARLAAQPTPEPRSRNAVPRNGPRRSSARRRRDAPGCSTSWPKWYSVS